MTGALIIGVGSGLGRAIAAAFATECSQVSLIARSPARLAVLAEDVRRTGAEVDTYAVDVRDEIPFREAIASSVRRFGTPDVLVYNAAIIQQDGIGQLDAEQHERAWGVNVVGAITAAAEIAPLMTDRGSGTILITGGMPTPDPDYVSLSLGKAGVRTLIDLLAQRCEPAGVHVATVTVGGAITPGTALDPDLIATHFVRLHEQPVGSWQREVVLPDTDR